MKIAILASTNGSNLPSLFTYIQKNYSDIECMLVTNKSEAGAIEKAKLFSIPYFIISAEKNMQREEYDAKVLNVLKAHSVDYVFMVGYMRIVSDVFVEAYRNKIFNVHPSLLPAFAGGMSDNVHNDVLDFGCKITGATLHIVSEEVDAGAIVDQMACRINDNETVASLKPKVQKLEQEMLQKCVVRLYNQS